MKAPYELTHWWLPILCILVLIGWKVDATGFIGVDMAHHYALVQRLVEKWRFAPADDLVALSIDWQSLGEMIQYPALSHRLAAIVGQVLGSAFLGMQVVALMATAMIWAGIGAALLSAPRTSAWVAALVTAPCLAVTTLVFHLPVHGGEVVNAYFFAQLVGQAFAIACVLAWVSAQRRGDAVALPGLLMLAAPSAVAWFHLLPALQLLAFFGCAALVEGWTASPGHRRRRFFINGGLTAAGAVLLSVNPSVRAMLDIATNNGDLPLALPAGNGVFAALAIIVLGLVAINLVLWQRLALRLDGRAFVGFKALILFAAAAALLCLAQIGAVEMGIGNDYAVRKYIYSLMSGIAVQAGVLAGLIVALRRSDPDAAAEGARPHGLAVSVFMIAAFALTTPPHLWEGAATVTARIVGYERQVKVLRDTRVPAAQGRHDVVAGLAGVPPAISYMFSIGLMGTPRDMNATAILLGREMPEPDNVGSIIASVGAAPYDVRACRSFVSASGLTIVDGSCYATERQRRQACEGEFDFRLGGSAGNFDHLLSGFSSPEPAGRWTDGDAASFRCRQPEGLRAAVRVTLETSAFLHPTQGPKRQRAIVKLNGRPVAEHIFTADAGEKIFDLPLSVADGPEVEIVIETPDAAVPADQGLGNDPRRLGVQVRRIQFSPTPAGQ
ncbi:MAG: DUF7024 domain-containing protein [Niveispirillum sp.]|uniref:DUF7024 domain-containing protein n=1 Tax=Niveispirillum sp. TaxID=1917217 RepID=UPI003BA675A0